MVAFPSCTQRKGSQFEIYKINKPQDYSDFTDNQHSTIRDNTNISKQNIMMSPSAPKAIVVGGSLAGLFAGNLLRANGWDVHIYERSSQNRLNSRGGGIVLQPDILAAFEQAGIPYQYDSMGVVAHERVHLDREGRVEHRSATRQMLTSWNLIFDKLYHHFPNERYHIGQPVVGIKQNSDSVTATFADGSTQTADLLVGADGARSVVRKVLLPDVKARYSGYIAYRGLVPESELDAATAKVLTDRFVLYQFPDSHLLQYVIPGEDGSSLEVGERQFNWVWYVNYDEQTELPILLTDNTGKQRDLSLPPGAMASVVQQHMRDYANKVLPPPLQRLIEATKEPFIQSVMDLNVDHMAHGRVALVGDAAFMPRPHTASGVSKGAANAMSLADALKASGNNIVPGLKRWETGQLRLGWNLEKRGQAIGRQSQFMYGQGRHLGIPLKDDETRKNDGDL